MNALSILPVAERKRCHLETHAMMEACKNCGPAFAISTGVESDVNYFLVCWQLICLQLEDLAIQSQEISL